jgi:hypothetical protein
MADIEDIFALGNNNLFVDPGLETFFIEYFTATPSIIPPFGESLLEWKVTGSVDPPIVKINTQVVPAEGSMVVRPNSSSVYRLMVRDGSAFRRLGQVSVDIDKTDCEVSAIETAENLMRSVFEVGIRRDPDVYFKKRVIRQGFTYSQEEILPVASVDETGIDLSLRLKKRINNFPNPTIKADVKFRWIIVNNIIVHSYLKTDVSISFPWWVYALPGAIPSLAIAASLAEDEVIDSINHGLEEFVGFILSPPPGRRILSIRTMPENGGTIEYEHCAEEFQLKQKQPDVIDEQ